MRTQVRKIGNSLGNIIPATFIKQLGLVEGADIEVKADGKKIIIEPIKRQKKKRFPFSERELLNGLDAHTAHADELALVSGKELGE
jgi:antitoxin MazE